VSLASHFKAAANNLLYSPLRSFLSMLGCLIGTASIVILISSGNLASEKSMEIFKSLGTNQMALSLSNKKTQEEPQHVMLDVLLGMKPVIHEIQLIAPYTNSQAQVSYQNVAFNAAIIGSTALLSQVIKINMSRGRFFSDLDGEQKFCVIGSKIVTQLKSIDPLGLRIKLGKSFFTVIGVVETWPENGFFAGDVNNSIIVPLQLVSRITSFAPGIQNLIMNLESNADIDLVKDRINKYFTTYLPNYTVMIMSAKEMIKNMNAQRAILALLLGFIGGVSLFVAGIGIMNIMLASVAERRYEIGLRLAIGAQPKDIQAMFLTEAVILAMAGGGLGVLMGIITTYFLALFSGWTFELFLLPPTIGFSFSVLISMFFGFYPAYIASQSNPIDALRAS